MWCFSEKRRKFSVFLLGKANRDSWFCGHGFLRAVKRDAAFLQHNEQNDANYYKNCVKCSSFDRPSQVLSVSWPIRCFFCTLPFGSKVNFFAVEAVLLPRWVPLC